jgi:hypothetical protein
MKLSLSCGYKVLYIVDGNCRNEDTTTTLTLFDELPDEAIYHIFSFISSDTLEDMRRLFQTLGPVSKFFRNKVKEFGQATPIRYQTWWIKRPYNEIAWLRDNQIRIGTLVSSGFRCTYFDAGILTHLLQECNISGMSEVVLGVTDYIGPFTYPQKMYATRAGIPGEVVDRILDEAMKTSQGDRQV